jgi:hypothetical protein
MEKKQVINLNRMKSIICFLLLTLFTLSSYSQDKKTEKIKGVRIVETFPKFKNDICDDDAKKCFRKRLMRYFIRNISPLIDNPTEFGIAYGKKRALIIFSIDKIGYVRIKEITSSDPKLNIHIKNAFNALPQVIPGTQRLETVGEPDKNKPIPVKMSYQLPIIFNIE